MSALSPRIKDDSYKKPKSGTVADEGIPQNEKEAIAGETLKSIQNLQKQWSEGNLPPNASIDEFLSSVEDVAGVRDNRDKLSADGRVVVDKWSVLINSLRTYVAEKNEHELLQKFVSESKQASTLGWQQHGDNAKQVHADSMKKIKTAIKNKKVTEDEVGGDAMQAYSHAITVAKLLGSSSRFRQLIAHITSLSQYLVAGVAEQSAEALRANGNKRLQQSQADSSATLSPISSRDSKPDSLAFSLDGKTLSEGIHGHSSPAVAQTEDSIIAAPAAESDVLAQPEQKSTIMNKISAQNKERLASAKATAIDVFNNEIPPQKREQIENDLRSIIRELISQPEYQDAIRFFIHLVRSTAESSSQTAQKTASGDSISSEIQGHLKASRTNLQTFIERLANGYNLDNLYNSVQQIKVVVQNDSVLKGHFKDLGLFLQDSLSQPGFVDRDDWKSSADARVDAIRSIMQDKYKPQSTDLQNQLSAFNRGLTEDALNLRVKQATIDLGNSLAKNPEGHYTFKKDLVADFTDVILPAFIQKFRFIPLPPITIDNNSMHMVISNIILTTSNVLPNIIEMFMQNNAVLGLRSGISSRHAHVMELNLYQIQAKINDVGFVLHRKNKKGVSSKFDEGKANILLGGSGLSIQCSVELHPEDLDKSVTVKKVKAHIDTLKLKLHDTKHDILYAMGTTLFGSTIKKQITKNIEKQVIDAVGKIDDVITQSKRNSAQSAKDKAAKAAEQTDKKLQRKDVSTEKIAPTTPATAQERSATAITA